MEKYAFLMIKYKTPSFIKEIQNKIDNEDLYYSEDSDVIGGIENDSHVTVAPCMDNDTDISKLKKLLSPLKEYEAFATNISKFTADKYDVLKCDIASIPLFNTNARIKEKYTFHTEFKDYNPHMTIAYVKKGTCDNFLKKILDKLIIMKPTNFWYTYYDKNGNSKKIEWK